MPANKKYLSSNWQRFSKILAAIIGGYLVTITSHMVLAFWFYHPNVIITSSFSGFILWVILMIVSFLAKNGWKILGLYLLIAVLLSTIIYFSKIYHPI